MRETAPLGRDAREAGALWAPNRRAGTRSALMVVWISKSAPRLLAGRHLAKPKSRQREARGAPGRRSVGRGRLVAMAANVTGGPKFKMPRGASGEEVARIVEKGKARALETGASAGRASSSARPVPVAEAHVPILAVDGVADGGVYLSKSTKGRGGEIEEEGLKREARLNALRRLDPGVAKKLRELKDAEVSSSSSSSSSSSMSSSSGESSSGSDSSSLGKRRGRRGDRKRSKKRRRRSSSSSGDGEARARKKLEKRSRETLEDELRRLRKKNATRERRLERGSRKSSGKR